MALNRAVQSLRSALSSMAPIHIVPWGPKSALGLVRAAPTRIRNGFVVVPEESDIFVLTGEQVFQDLIQESLTQAHIRRHRRIVFPVQAMASACGLLGSRSFIRERAAECLVSSLRVFWTPELHPPLEVVISLDPRHPETTDYHHSLVDKMTTAAFLQLAG